MPIPRRQFLGLGAAAAASAVAGCGAGVAAGPRTPGPSFPAFDGKIEHFIVLMLENRSYDQMLGALTGAEYDGAPRGTRLAYEPRDGSPASVPIEYGAPPDCFYPDPGHGFRAVEAQIRGRGLDHPADMGGFARRFLVDHPGVLPSRMQQYATLYGEGHLPVLQGLAREYGVCTHWFCSLPSSTTPNRMFTHAGTSGGATRAGAYYSRIRGRQIFDKLGGDPRAWRIYFHDLPHLWLAGDTWTKTFGGHFHFMGAFANDVAADRLATYSFLEPQHVIPPWSSQHPSGGVSHGEKLIASVYNALVANPRVFRKSLLLIVYDEHGGFYDHVIPPGHPGWKDPYPGVEHEVVRPDEAVGVGTGSENGYAFDTLGPRVPAVVDLAVDRARERVRVEGPRSGEAGDVRSHVDPGDRRRDDRRVGRLAAGARGDEPRGRDQPDHAAGGLSAVGELRRERVPRDGPERARRRGGDGGARPRRRGGAARRLARGARRGEPGGDGGAVPRAHRAVGALRGSRSPSPAPAPTDAA